MTKWEMVDLLGTHGKTLKPLFKFINRMKLMTVVFASG